MSSKSKRRKKMVAQESRDTTTDQIQPVNSEQFKTMRPTPERKSRGSWAVPQGGLKSQQPMVDVASDMIGQLLVAKQITSEQEQAARQWQELRARYVAEMPEIQGYKSCLAGSVPGYDDGDGNPAVIAEYRGIERALGWRLRREVLWVADLDNAPTRIETLRAALDVIAGVK